MFAKTVMAAFASTALLASVATAQTPTTTTERSGSASMPESSLQGDWRASKVVGLSVYNDKNEKLGSVNDLLMDKSGNIKAVVLGVGGFLGMGEHLVAVPLDKVKFVNEPVVYTGTTSTSAPAAGSSMNRPPSPPTTTGSASTAAPSKPNPWYPDHAVFDATKDSLKAMPEFKYAS
jgi:sporulation protein YlmC with PRC-barrel domain